LLPTGVVVMLKVVKFCPAAIETLAGVIAALLLLDRLTITPPAGAALNRVTVPIADVPPSNDEGSRERLATAGGGMTVIVVDTVFEETAVTMTLRVAVTGLVVTGKFAVV